MTSFELGYICKTLLLNKVTFWCSKWIWILGRQYLIQYKLIYPRYLLKVDWKLEILGRNSMCATNYGHTNYSSTAGLEPQLCHSVSLSCVFICKLRVVISILALFTIIYLWSQFSWDDGAGRFAWAQDFEASLGHIVKPCQYKLKKKKQINTLF